EAPTALTSVLALESLDGPPAEVGITQAKGLRGEFADSLVEVGDRFWADDATRAIARDYYLKAFVFDSSRDVAFERAGVTLGQFAEFKAKAERADFSQTELLAGQFGSALALEDKEERDAILMETLEVAEPLSLVGRATRIRAAKNVGVSTTVLEAIAEPGATNSAGSASEDVTDSGADPKSTSGAAEEELEDEGTETGESRADDATDGREAADGAAGTPTQSSAKPKSRSSRANDPAKSKELAAAGAKALASGDRKRAAQLFHQALSYNQRNSAALMGLSDVYFDTGKPQQAVTYAERAVRAAPSSSRYRLKLGDALFKVLRYQEALTQYREAKKLGSKRAASRIEKVNAKLGR
ncbi:MAG: tetratricopeptide repeat protein, partial [Nannocystaceae bacterium]